MLDITDSQEMGAIIVHPRGKLDTLTAKTFEQHMQRHVDESAGPLLIDLQGIDYVSSFGLRSILSVPPWSCARSNKSPIRRSIRSAD